MKLKCFRSGVKKSNETGMAMIPLHGIWLSTLISCIHTYPSNKRNPEIVKNYQHWEIEMK
jgi:hypothetical protein